MPRDGSNVYGAPAGTLATSNTSISSTAYNAFVNDLVADANLARPIVAGGTGATSAAAARTNLGGTSVGQAVFTAADKAAGRAAIDAAPIPTNSAGVGQVVIINPSVGADAVLPAGGTWQYRATLYNSGVASNFAAGVAAGGTTIGAATPGQNWIGDAWRIA